MAACFLLVFPVVFSLPVSPLIFSHLLLPSLCVCVRVSGLLVPACSASDSSAASTWPWSLYHSSPVQLVIIPALKLPSSAYFSISCLCFTPPHMCRSSSTLCSARSFIPPACPPRSQHLISFVGINPLWTGLCLQSPASWVRQNKPQPVQL